MRSRIKAAATAAAIAALGLGLAPAAHAYVFDVCPSMLSGIATDVTSCPFADSVRATWYANPSTLITAYSPVTGRAYYMSCSVDQTVTLTTGRRLAVLCTGGNDAEVVFW